MDADEVSLKSKAVVAAHDKDINSLSVSPNDGLVCSGSEVRFNMLIFLEGSFDLSHWIVIISHLS